MQVELDSNRKGEKMMIKLETWRSNPEADGAMSVATEMDEVLTARSPCQ
jgi:hypothetical protein